MLELKSKIEYMQVNPIRSEPVRILRLKHKRESPASEARKVAFATKEGHYIIPVVSIIHCEAWDNYCQVIRKDGSSLLVTKTLKAVDTALSSHGFLRVHQSHLVSIGEITFVGPDHLLLSSGKQIPVSRTKRAEVMRKIMESVQLV